MKDGAHKKPSRIKSITIRFNREVTSFQHIRIEATSTITKDDDKDEVARELEDYLETCFRQIERRIYGKESPVTPEQPTPGTEPDNIPY